MRLLTIVKVLSLLMFAKECVSEKIDLPSTYTAGVVEFSLEAETIESKKLDMNTKRVVDIIQSDETADVDILVFPEAILNTERTGIYFSNSFDGHSLCEDPEVHSALRNISCAVRETGKYVVINLYIDSNCTEDAIKFADHRPCSDPEKLTNLNNMALVFDRHGAVIAKYRKYNLFSEKPVRRPLVPDVVTFQTDFNVTFGVFICFDLFFQEPPMTLVDAGIKHFVYPTMWFSELPFLTAVQIQQAWAYAHKVNLLAANANRPTLGGSGSGIYAGQAGIMTAIVGEKPVTKVLKAKIPINGAATDFSDESKYVVESNDGLQAEKYLNLWKEDLSKYSIRFLDFSTNSTQTGELCQNDICCRYSIDVKDNGERASTNSYQYAIAMLNGYRTYKYEDHLLTGQEVCGLIACTSFDSRESCAQRYHHGDIYHRYHFNAIRLETALPVRKMTIMANTLVTTILPMNATQFDLQKSKSKDEGTYIVRLELLEPKSDLLTFAIFSRDYSKDMVSGGTNEYNRLIAISLISGVAAICFIKIMLL